MNLENFHYNSKDFVIDLVGSGQGQDECYIYVINKSDRSLKMYLKEESLPEDEFGEIYTLIVKNLGQWQIGSKSYKTGQIIDPSFTASFEGIFEDEEKVSCYTNDYTKLKIKGILYRVGFVCII